MLKFIILTILLSLAANGSAVAKQDNDSLLKQIDELHQMYADYNFIDNAYDHMHSVRKELSEALMANFYLQSKATPDGSNVYMASKFSEDLSFKLSEMELSKNALNQRKVLPQLEEFKKIVNQMLDNVYKDYSNYQKIKTVMAIINDSNLRETLKVTGSDEEKQIVQSNPTIETVMMERTNIDKELEGLEEKLSQEQDKLIEYHKKLAESIKADIS